MFPENRGSNLFHVFTWQLHSCVLLNICHVAVFSCLLVYLSTTRQCDCGPHLTAVLSKGNAPTSLTSCLLLMNGGKWAAACLAEIPPRLYLDGWFGEPPVVAPHQSNQPIEDWSLFLCLSMVVCLKLVLFVLVYRRGEAAGATDVWCWHKLISASLIMVYLCFSTVAWKCPLP